MVNNGGVHLLNGNLQAASQQLHAIEFQFDIPHNNTTRHPSSVLRKCLLLPLPFFAQTPPRQTHPSRDLPAAAVSCEIQCDLPLKSQPIKVQLSRFLVELNYRQEVTFPANLGKYLRTPKLPVTSWYLATSFFILFSGLCFEPFACKQSRQPPN